MIIGGIAMTKHTTLPTMGRRSCLRAALVLGAGILAGAGFTSETGAAMQQTTVFLVKTDDRVRGIRDALSRFDLSKFKGADVALKANYNSADPFPASTHPDTLRTFASVIREAGANRVELAERSGMGNTAHVLEAMGANRIAEELGMTVTVMDDLGADGYVGYQPEKSHWERGFMLARPFVEADMVVQTCCLKTHQYGGHFTLSLKNAVGAVAKYDPADRYNYMRELHSADHQRSMIAEISQVYRNDLILMDGMKAFVNGGPHVGKEVEPGVIIAGTDPVAVDAVGVAILRQYDTTPEVSRGRIFDQEQIRCAAEAGVGVDSPDRITLMPMGDGAEKLAERVRNEFA